jgi:hypothetical protein
MAYLGVLVLFRARSVTFPHTIEYSVYAKTYEVGTCPSAPVTGTFTFTS